jgi:hypothetical protein
LYSPLTMTKPSAGAISLGQRFLHWRRLALWVFLIHAIEKRQPLLQRIDEGGGVAAAGELVDDKAGCFDALSGLSYRSVKNDEAQRHPNPPQANDVSAGSRIRTASTAANNRASAMLATQKGQPKRSKTCPSTALPTRPPRK